jgi:hypothetical protein
MPSGPEYTVDFNPEVGWTLIYGDSFGRLVFVFEPGETAKVVSLDPTPLENDHVVIARDAATHARLDLALERTREFLVTCGYEVRVQGKGEDQK